MQYNYSLEANSCSTSQAILRILWKPEVPYRVHNSEPLIPILRHVNSVHNFPHCSSNNHSNIILSSTFINA